MALELYANDAAATVSSGGTDAPVPGTVEMWTIINSTLPAVSSSGTPATVCYVSDPAALSEKILVTNISGSTATVTRGADSTTPVTHATGFNVRQVLTHESLVTLQSTLQLAATTGLTGYSLADSTGTILSWVTPNDGAMHRVIISATQSVTTAETGGSVGTSIVTPDNVTNSPAVFAGGDNVGYQYFTSMYQLYPGTTVALEQKSALSGGAATVWAEMWGF